MSKAPADWPEPLTPFWVNGADVHSAASLEEETPGRDGMGNSGRIRELAHRGRFAICRTRDEVVERLVEGGLEVTWTGSGRTELARPRRSHDRVLSDPFLLEDSLKAIVHGRDFPGRQREVVEKKVASLRAELDGASLAASRRDAATAMIEELEDGLRASVELSCITRRFHPHVELALAVESFGNIVPIRAGTRIVYRVNTIDAEHGREGEAEPMAFHVLGVGANEAALMFTGGVCGQRHLTDLEGSRVHNAWFANRERRRSDATAPWIGRALFRQLRDEGSGEIVIHVRRDPEPIGIETVGEDVSFLRIDGRPMEVPVIRCRTSQQDDLIVLNDEDCPLVLRLDERGAELMRTIDDVLSAPGHKFVFDGDAQLADAAAEIVAAMDAIVAE